MYKEMSRKEVRNKANKQKDRIKVWREWIIYVTSEMEPSGQKLRPFRLAKNSQAEWNQGRTQTFRPNICIRQICLYFLKQHFISLQFFKKCSLVSGPCFKVNACTNYL